jgi:hypothetical protein
MSISAPLFFITDIIILILPERYDAGYHCRLIIIAVLMLPHYCHRSDADELFSPERCSMTLLYFTSRLLLLCLLMKTLLAGYCFSIIQPTAIIFHYLNRPIFLRYCG